MNPSVVAKEEKIRNTDIAQSGVLKEPSTRMSAGQAQNLGVDPWYFGTIPGILKMLQLVVAMVCMGCASPVMTRYTQGFMAVVAIFFCFTVIFFFVYFFNLRRLTPEFPWLIIELTLTVLATVLYLIVSVVQLVYSKRDFDPYGFNLFDIYDYYMVAGAFGILNFVAYLAGAIFLFLEWKKTAMSNTSTAAPAAAGATSAAKSH